MIHLLRITSTEADESNVGSALENLKELYQSVSLIGDSVQRVVAYFPLRIGCKAPHQEIPLLRHISSSSSSFFAVLCCDYIG